jgi:hypothetical protein
MNELASKVKRLHRCPSRCLNNWELVANVRAAQPVNQVAQPEEMYFLDEINMLT